MKIRFKSKFYYTDEELKIIKEQWLKDRARIDSDTTYGYYWDRHSEYAKYLATENLRTMFRMVAHLYRHLQDGAHLYLYMNEDILITDVFRRIEANGYFDKSKIKEKKNRTRIGKISSRQSYRRYIVKNK